MPPQIEIALLRICAECSSALTVGQSYSIDVNGKTLRLSVEAISGQPPKPDSECEEDVYDAVRLLIGLHGRRVTTKEVFAELEAANHIWGRSTVVCALAALVHKGLLLNPRDKKGYGIGATSFTWSAVHSWLKIARDSRPTFSN